MLTEVLPLPPFQEMTLRLSPQAEGLGATLIYSGFDVPSFKDVPLRTTDISLALPYTSWANLVPHSGAYATNLWEVATPLTAQHLLNLLLTEQRPALILECPSTRYNHHQTRELYEELQRLVSEHRDELKALGYSVTEFHQISEVRSDGFKQFKGEPVLIVAKTLQIESVLPLAVFSQIVDLLGLDKGAKPLVGKDYKNRLTPHFRLTIEDMCHSLFFGIEPLFTSKKLHYYEAELLYLYLCGIPVEAWASLAIRC